MIYMDHHKFRQVYYQPGGGISLVESLFGGMTDSEIFGSEHPGAFVGHQSGFVDQDIKLMLSDNTETATPATARLRVVKVVGDPTMLVTNIGAQDQVIARDVRPGDIIAVTLGPGDALEAVPASGGDGTAGIWVLGAKGSGRTYIYGLLGALGLFLGALGYFVYRAQQD